MNGSVFGGCGRGNMNGVDVVMIMIMIIMEIGVRAEELSQNVLRAVDYFDGQDLASTL
jgi:hypothetical protein